MKAIRRLVLPFFILVILLHYEGAARAQSGESQFFPETGHRIEGDFLRFYRSLRNAQLIIGYPITEQIQSKDGKSVQYFQRARLELRPGPGGNLRVEPTPLGRVTYEPSNQLTLSNTAGCDLFPNGYPVCFAFLDFFRANGGVAEFGDPISPFEFHDNMIVQYFEKARFEWRADRPEGQRVMLTNLGQAYFYQLQEDPTHLKPVLPLDAASNPILAIKVRAFVARSVTASNGRQSVFVLIQSQTGQAISNATGKATILWPAGSTEDYYFTTNDAGLGIITFDFWGQTPGELIQIEIAAAYRGLVGTTRTSFRIWL